MTTIGNLVAGGVEKGIAHIATGIVEWPFAMYYDVLQNVYMPPLVALSLSYYIFGPPTMSRGGAELAKQYLVTGVVFEVATAIQQANDTASVKLKPVKK